MSNETPIAEALQSAPATSSRVREILTIVLASTLFTLAAFAPIAYMASQRMPPRLATVDLQKLVEEDQERAIKIIGSGSLNDDQRASLEKVTAEFAVKLSTTIDAVGQECGCVLVNKAALLGGAAADYTDLVRQRMK